MLFEVIEGKKSSGRIVRVLVAVALSLAMMVSLVTPVWALEEGPADGEDVVAVESDEKEPEAAEPEETESEAEPEVKESAKAEPKAEPKAEAKAEPETDEDEKEPEAEEKADVFGAGTLSNDTVKKYLIKVTYSEKAEIPEGASLVVKEIKKSDDEYKAQASDTAEAVGSSVDELSYLKMFDISIVDKDGNEIEPADKVDVKIEYKDPIEGIDQDNLKVVHFGEKKTEVIVPETKTEDGKVEELSFETSSFSIYSVVSNNTTTDLDGKTFAIINRYRNTAMQGHATNNRRLAAAAVTVDTRNGQDYIRTTEDVTFWTFESAGGNTYYIKSDKGEYLNITGTNNNGTVSVSDTPQALTVTAGTGGRAGRVRITNDNNICASNINGNIAGGYGASTASNDNDWLSLYDMTAFDPDFAAEKISVQDIEDAQRLLIYRSIYDPATEKFEDYVIDGNGNLVKVWDKSDQIVGRSAVSPVWVVTFGRTAQGELTGYYIFQNEETGLVLSPQADGTLVAPYDSPTTSGVTLNGRRDGKYISTIEKWDSSAWAWYGYEFTRDSEGNEILKSGTGEHSQEISFAAYITNETHELHPVKTISSKDAGIVINMFNYPNRSTIANVTGSDGYAEGKLPAQHASMTLNSEGYPTFKNNKNGKTLFDPAGSYFQGTGDNLFLESIYNSTGYYEYNAFNNFAHYDKNSESFTVYQETGTPSNENKFYFKRGNFFPYNNLDVNRPATNQNMYDGSGQQLDIHDPTDHGTLYMVQSPDFYYGMTVEATFMQPKGGLENGDPVVYEFNGDDDLWIYIDGVLILDIGGVHDAWPGSINFATGQIHGRGAGAATTIKDCFKKAGVFPDGTPWDDSRVDEYFRGNTFIDYGSHTFKMFYMEHGAGASNLEMRFNLPVIEKGKFTVEKELSGTNQGRYSNVYFAYQAFKKGSEGNDIPLHEAVYEGTTNEVRFYDNVEINGKTYDDVFYLKPGEAATFAELAEVEEYYVQELGIGSDYYAEVWVNDVKIDGQDVTPVDGIYPTSVATVANRARVTYSNHLSEKNKVDLRITKRISEGCVDEGAKFEFRVQLENANGELKPYSTGQYYIQDDNGDYYRYEGGMLVNNGKTEVVASVAGNNGTIAGIPANFTVIIKDLVSDTDFHVEEIRNPSGWKQVNKEVVADTYDESTLEGTDWSGKAITADGKTKLEKDAQVVITNKTDQKIKVNKVWESGELVKDNGHGAVNVALFTTDSEGQLVLVEGSVRAIEAPATSLEYTVSDVTKYTVREVVVDGSKVEPVDNGKTIVVSGENTTVADSVSDTYVAAYEEGEVVEAHEGQDGKTVPTTREDTVTNSMAKTTVVKVDDNDTPLAGAKFRMLKSDKKTVVPGYSEMETAADGLVFQNKMLPNGIYYLEEVETPAGYIGLPHMLVLRVTEDGITLMSDELNTPTEYQDKDTANLSYEFHVENTPGTELPSSGGIGTTLFYIIGALLTAGCILLIMAKRRMA